MVTVVHISEVDTEELFKTKQYLLGDNTGDWFVVAEGDLYLGRYEDKERAEWHAASVDGDPSTDEELELALKFAKGVEDDNS